MVVVEEDADGDMQQYADDDAHDESLQHFVLGHEVAVAEGSEGCHDGKYEQESEGFPERIAVVHKEADQDEGDGDVVQDDAPEEALVDVAVEVDKWHAFEEGMDAEAYDESCDRVDAVFVAVALVVEMGVVVFVGFGIFFTAGTVVVAVFGTFGELFQQQLDEEAYHDGCRHLEMQIGGDKPIVAIAEEHVGHKVDEA